MATEYNTVPQEADDLNPGDSVDIERKDSCNHDWYYVAQEENRKRIQQLHYLAWFQGSLIIILVGYILFAQIFTYETHHTLLGTDPSGFVESEIGQPLKWTKYDDESDPYYLKPDGFDSIEKVQKAVRRFKEVYNTSGVYVNGKHTTYIDLDGNRQPLPPYVTSGGSELYAIRAFHQIHCIFILFEDSGYLRNNRTSKWNAEHVIHCINTLRSAVTCLADATPISYIHGNRVGHTTDGQQALCRDFHALRDWAHDPVRFVHWVNTGSEDKTDVDKEVDRDG